MPERNTENRHLLPLPDAAAMLRLTEPAVEALATAGYITPAATGRRGPEFPVSDLKAFLARNADNGSGNLFDAEPADVDAQDLLDALDARSEEMARRALDLFAGVYPDAAAWTMKEQARFVEQARGRFEAILAVTSQGSEVDEALVDDLQGVGANAAATESSLPQLLVMLRISRDLVVQTAVELAEERGSRSRLALSLLLTRVLPAMDRLTDAIAQGYWSAILGREAEGRARSEHVVEQSSDGIYEVDLDGIVRYANPALAATLGRPPDQIHGRHLADVIVPLDPGSSIERLTSEPAGDVGRSRITVVRPDGVHRVLDVRTSVRRGVDGELVGFQGVLVDVTLESELEADKNEFLSLVSYDLRNPLTTILGLATTLESHAGELTPDRITHMGGEIRRQAERMAGLADDLDDVSRVESRSLQLRLGPTDLLQSVTAALGPLAGEPGMDVRVAPGVVVVADAERLRQVVANLVDNAVEHGARPIVIEVVETLGSNEGDGAVTVAVSDHGDGVAEAVVPSLFSGVRTLGRRARDRSRGTGLGLSLVRGLVEAMGGRVWYQPAEQGGASFRFTLPVPLPPPPPPA